MGIGPFKPFKTFKPFNRFAPFPALRQFQGFKVQKFNDRLGDGNLHVSRILETPKYKLARDGDVRLNTIIAS